MISLRQVLILKTGGPAHGALPVKGNAASNATCPLGSKPAKGGASMKVLVTYFSQSGNTRKVAEAIFQEIQASKEIRELAQVDSLDGYNLTFLGFPIQAFGPAQQAAAFMEKHAAGKNLALFITHAAPEDSTDLQQWLANCRALAAGANLVGMFDCQGELSEQVADLMSKSGDERLAAWAKDRPSTLGQPDDTSLQRARAWARELLQKHVP